MSLQPGCRELGGPRGAQAPFLRVMGTAGEAGTGPVTDTSPAPPQTLVATSGHGQGSRCIMDSRSRAERRETLLPGARLCPRCGSGLRTTEGPRVHTRDSPEEPHVTSAVQRQWQQHQDTHGLTPPSPAGPVTGRRARRTQHPAPPSRHRGPPSITACSSSFLPCFPHPRGRERHEESASARGCLKHLVKKTNRSFLYCLLK